MDAVTSLYHCEYAKKYINDKSRSNFIIWRMTADSGQIIEYMFDHVNGGTTTRVLPSGECILKANGTLQ